ncbi:MAG: hypothetical protein ACTH6S_07800 [Mesonia sp.]|uniref:hypothetical protein n=1 Tax=Mesonia sp. TaxID=1960830 RepID=UPI003F95EB7C
MKYDKHYKFSGYLLIGWAAPRLRDHLGGITIIWAYLPSSGTYSKMQSEMHNSTN